MKYSILIALLLIVTAAYSQPQKSGNKASPPKRDTSSNPMVFTDTLAQKSDTVKVKYYYDVDSLNYVGVGRGYLVRTRTFSNKVQQLQSTNSTLYDEAWKRIDGAMIMNVREFDW
jgi:high-affinity Fe2+/Pb2+ permease